MGNRPELSGYYFSSAACSFFNISIDELMGYEPQMGREDIRKLHLRLSADFASQPFDEVLENCRVIAKKYFSCFPLLFQIGALLVNNSMESSDMDKALAVIAEAKEMFIRVNTESEDAELKQLALNMEAFCALTLGNPNEAIELLEGTSRNIISTETLLAQAYQMTGKSREAKSALQVGIYQHMISLFRAFPDYLMLCTDNLKQFEKTFTRAVAVILAAQGYTMFGNTDRTLDTLEEYAELVTGNIYPLKLKGDDYFNLIDEWFKDMGVQTNIIDV